MKEKTDEQQLMLFFDLQSELHHLQITRKMQNTKLPLLLNFKFRVFFSGLQLGMQKKEKIVIFFTFDRVHMFLLSAPM